MLEIKKMLESVFSGNLNESTDSFKSVIAEKIAEKLKYKKKTIHSSCTERYDADLDANKNGKLDEDDFKKLRAKKKPECHSACEEVELEENDLDEGVADKIKKGAGIAALTAALATTAIAGHNNDKTNAHKTDSYGMSDAVKARMK